jgi:Ca2+-binding EF-hand superfamily protein
MKKSPIALAVVSALSLSLVPALASAHGAIPTAMQSGSSGVSSSFSALDSNQDGMISQDEADRSDMLKDSFTQADVNQDGSIDASELSAFETSAGTAAAADTFSNLDLNNDGYLLPNEVTANRDLANDYLAIDKDRDGWISKREYQAHKGMAMTVGLTPFRTLDTNKDGALSMREANVDPVVAEQFNAYDKDQNGIIDRAEFSALEASHSGAAGKTY